MYGDKDRRVVRYISVDIRWESTVALGRTKKNGG